MLFIVWKAPNHFSSAVDGNVESASRIADAHQGIGGCVEVVEPLTDEVASLTFEVDVIAAVRCYARIWFPEVRRRNGPAREGWSDRRHPSKRRHAAQRIRRRSTARTSKSIRVSLSPS